MYNHASKMWRRLAVDFFFIGVNAPRILLIREREREREGKEKEKEGKGREKQERSK